MSTAETNEEFVRISQQGFNYGVGSITINGLSKEEAELLEAAVKGHQWVRVVNGRLESVPAYKTLPGPYEDESMLPFWRRASSTEGGIQEFLFDPDRSSAEQGFASIYISHLCGYNYSPGNYAREAAKLERFGFECMRSRRGDDGSFWETWYLPGLWAAMGGLGDVIKSLPAAERKDGRKELERATAFLCSSVSFGTLDVVVQRAAMVIK